jgi:hypothetical protein
MKKRVNTSIVLVTLVFLLAACSSVTPPQAEPNTLTVVKVDEAALNASADFWANAPKLEVSSTAAKEGNPDGPVVTLQAVHDGNNIVFRAEWADVTESVLKNSWTWDGSAFSKSGDEDRIMFVWPMGNNAEFASQGCATACHNTSENSDEWWMGSDSEDVRYDAWQWKAARTNPAGYVDDKWWGTQEDPTDVESSRHGDSKDSGGYADNRNEDKTAPIFLSSKGNDVQFIFSGEEVELDTASLQTGAVIPGYVLTKPVGSRGDIETQGTWTDGKWVVVIRRPLNTEHDDDVVYTPSKPMPFGLAVVDSGGGINHTISSDVLTLNWE